MNNLNNNDNNLNPQVLGNVEKVSENSKLENVNISKTETNEDNDLIETNNKIDKQKNIKKINSIEKIITGIISTIVFGSIFLSVLLKLISPTIDQHSPTFGFDLLFTLLAFVGFVPFILIIIFIIILSILFKGKD